MSKLADYERVIANNSPAAEERTRIYVVAFLVGGVLASSVLAFGLALFFNRGTVARLSILVDNTQRLSSNQLLHPHVGGADEIAHLDRVFHDMATALDQAAQQKKELIAMVSHDLRTPLMSVQSALTLMRSGIYGTPSEQLARTLAQTERNAEQLIRLINDLLDIEKLEAGRLPMMMRPMVLSDVFDMSFESVSALAEEQHVGIEVIDSRMELEADPERLTQVLINLLSNAIKFSPPDSTITVQARDDGNHVVVSVIDEGRGVPEHLQAKIFERFQQVESGDGARGKGTGLGLAICKAIIESHGGTIGVKSNPSQGSEFWFRIPKQSLPEGTLAEESMKTAPVAAK